MRKLDYSDIEEGLIFRYGNDKNRAGDIAGIKCIIVAYHKDKDDEHCWVKTLEPTLHIKAGYKYEDYIYDIIKSGSTLITEERKAYHPTWW